MAAFILYVPLRAEAQQEREKLKVPQTAMLPLEGFSGLDVQLPVAVTIRQNETFQVKVEADYANLLEDMKIEAQANRLMITGSEELRAEMEGLKKFPIVRVEVEMPQIDYICLTGKAKLSVQKAIKCDSFELISKGQGDIKLEKLQSNGPVTLRILGKGDVKIGEISGTLADIQLDGEGDLELKRLNLQGAFKATLTGQGDLETGKISAATVDLTMNAKCKAELKEIDKSTKVSINVGAEGKVALGNIQTTELSIINSGKGDVQFKKVSAGTVSIQNEGKGSVKAKGNGTADRCTLSITGKGDVDISKLEAHNVDVNIDGKGSATVYATKELNVDSGTSKAVVKYRGAPRAIVAPNSRAQLKPIK